MIKEEEQELKNKNNFYLKLIITQFTLLLLSFTASIFITTKYAEERKQRINLVQQVQHCKSKNDRLFTFCKKKCFLLQKETFKQCRQLKETECRKVMEKYGTELVPQHMKRNLK